MDDYIWRNDLRPSISEQKKDILMIISKVLDSAKFVLADEVLNFEKAFAEYIGCSYGIGVASGTDAILYGLKALQVGPGDEVITTSFSAIPTLSAILMTGAEPVFLDIDLDTYLMDIEHINNFITPKTKAIIPVHIFGNVFDTEKMVKQLEMKIPVLEDCAQAHGASINGRKVGSTCTLGAFSFYPTKNLGCLGDGGLITTNDSNLEKELRLLRYYGMVNKDETIKVGTNSRLDELQAAILSYRLKYLEFKNKLRANKAQTYCRALPKDIFVPQKITSGANSCYHLFCGRVPENRDKLIKYLESQKIQSNVYYIKPLCRQEAYLNLYGKNYDVPNCFEVCSSIISLPFYPEISDEYIERVCNEIKRFYGYRL